VVVQGDMSGIMTQPTAALGAAEAKAFRGESRAVKLDGIIPILSMTFHDDDTIDHASLLAQAEFLIETGVTGVGFGFGSEIYRLTDAERDAALSGVATGLAGRIPIIVATGANSTHATVLRSTAARDAGATVLMIVPPTYSSAGPDEVFAHYATIAEQVGLPIIVQDAPSMTGVIMSDTLMARLANEVELVVAIKIEVIPPAPKVGTVVAKLAGSASVLGGAGGIDFAHEMERGAVGTIPGAALPELFVAVWQAFRDGRNAEGRALFNRFLPLLNLSGRSTDTFLFVQKEILRRRGILPNARLRTPSERIDPLFIGELDAMLADLGIADLGRHWDITSAHLTRA
jgi:dihydrodipicolinate synthase/N-acetylneuraminate lyase